ncbi:hypothetical protein QYM36_007738 [Artemia franciscana]|uniref:RNA-directed DNA polymerase n=1 Tax=Artemia franciscana TaxID=6661 RepID=A0AA88IF55_ARTSF|nr:hypothetical protein QYM36_007738 [Artemia franciscana]
MSLSEAQKRKLAPLKKEKEAENQSSLSRWIKKQKPSPCEPVQRRYGSRPFTDVGVRRWKDISNFLEKHTRSDRHKDSAVSWTKFKAIQTKELQPIASVLMTDRDNEIKENREHVKALLKVTALLERLGTAFRGHDETESSTNKGNFVETCNLLAEYSPTLFKEIQRRYSRYTSHEYQNDLISVIGIGPQKQVHRLPADMSETEFAELFDLSHVKDEFVRKRFIKLAYRFRDIFATHESHLGACEAVKHTINTGNAPPTKSRPYNVPHALRDVLKEKLDTLLEAGAIEEGDGPYAAPVILIKKKNGEYRKAVDYRKLNKDTVKDCYSLPVIQDILDRMANSRCFSVMDSISGFYQVPVDPNHRDKTGFITPFGLFRFKRAPFGLCNMPSTFQRLMDRVFKSLLHKTLECFLDDLISDTEKYRTPSKCFRTSFCKELSSPLTELTKKNVPFEWTELHSSAFNSLKEKLISSPILGLPRIGKGDYVLACEASNSAIAAKLSQVQDGREVVIHYGSRRLNKVEQNYSVTEKECLSVVYFTKLYRQYLYGVRFKVETDHLSLKWLLATKEPAGRTDRWVLSLQDLDFEVAYRPGSQNKVPDPLSRLPVVNAVVDSDSFLILPQAIDMEELRKAQKADRFCSSIVKYLAFKHIMPLDVEKLVIREIQNFVIENGVLCHVSTVSGKCRKREYRLVPVTPNNIAPKIMEYFHYSPYAGHFSTAKTFSRLKDRVFFPSMYSIYKRYCKSCLTCISRKSMNVTRKAPLQELPLLSNVLEMISIDLVGPSPKTVNGNTYFLSILDYFTRHIHLVNIVDAKAQTVLRTLVENYCHIFGFPTSILSDNGSHFKNQEFQDFCHKLGINHLFTSPEHAQSNGALERRHREVASILSQYVNQQHRGDWDA